MENKSKDNLRNRLIVGFTGFFVMLGGMFWLDWTYFIVFFIINLICLQEFYTLLIKIGKKPLKNYGVFLGVSLYTITFFFYKGIIFQEFLPLFYLFFLAIFFIKLYDKNDQTVFDSIAYTFLGLIYVAIPFSLLHQAVFFKGYYSYQIIIGVFFMIWIHDITAYFAGSKYGKTKLFKRISPNKSWEGSAVGLLSTLAMVVLLHQYFQDLLFWQWSVIGLIVAIIGTLGDLIESMLKRGLSIKDASNALPGHGGFLDRFDNLLFISPFIAIFLKIF